MGEFTEKSKSLANKVIGKSKTAAGRATDNPKLVVKGLAQQGKGKAQQASGAIKGKLGDKI